MKLERIEKFANDSKLDAGDIKACSALVEFILTSGAKNNVTSEILSSELQQLGLPKGVCLLSRHGRFLKLLLIFV